MSGGFLSRGLGRRGLRGDGLDQRDQADIGAAADALQHHVADAEGRFGAALLQRVAARVIEAGFGKIAQIRQRPRGVAGADQHAVARKCCDRRVDAFDQALQPLDQRHRAAGSTHRGDEHARAAVAVRHRQIDPKPRAAAGDEPAECRTKAAQPLQPDSAIRWQPACELRHLPPMRIGRTEGFFGKAGAIGGAEQPGADRIGPQNPRAVARPQPNRQRARRMHRQPRVADALQLEFREVFIVVTWPAGLNGCSTIASDTGRQTLTALTKG